VAGITAFRAYPVHTDTLDRAARVHGVSKSDWIKGCLIARLVAEGFMEIDDDGVYSTGNKGVGAGDADDGSADWREPEHGQESGAGDHVALLAGNRRAR
jgi:hypothetical protein